MLPSWQDSVILVVGDVMLDEYIDGDVHRISPEAPVPVLLVKEQFCVCGGAANAASGIRALGAETHLFCVLGTDDTSLLLQMQLKRASILTHSVVSSARPTIRKTRIISNGHQICRVDRESLSPLPDATQADLKKLVIASMSSPTTSAILLSDYGKGTLSRDLLSNIIETADLKNIPIVVDPKGKDFSKYSGATLITPNYKEACEAVGVDSSEKIPGEELGQTLLSKYNFEYVLVTLGADGMVLCWDNNSLYLPAMAREVYDVSGAGDTVAAVMTLCLSSRMNIEQAVHIANTAAGIAVTKPGTQAVCRDELLVELKRQNTVLNKVKKFFSGF